MALDPVPNITIYYNKWNTLFISVLLSKCM